MADHHYRILNVFSIADDAFSGNPLCVFEDARGLDTRTMQALALQFNLSETTFILPSEVATARVRIFTPSFEMPFAGHPTLGTAYVVNALRGPEQRGAVTLEMAAGIIPVSKQEASSSWTLEARPARTRPVNATQAELAQMLGLIESDIGEAKWVDTGNEQLVVPLTSAAAVERCTPVPELIRRHGSVNDKRCMVYIWSRTDADSSRVLARFFFNKSGSLVEDPATGSACANLGGYLAARHSVPVHLTVDQGRQAGRPSELTLRVTAEGQIYVSGRVVQLGAGTISLSA